MKRILLVVLGLALFATINTSCSTTVEPPISAPSIPNNPTVSWDQAIKYIGEKVTICGPVVGTHYANTSKGKPTFLNVGRDHPDPNRFTVVIWGQYRSNFGYPPPEEYYLDNKICVYGLVTEYEGIPQIEVQRPSQIQIQ